MKGRGEEREEREEEKMSRVKVLMCVLVDLNIERREETERQTYRRDIQYVWRQRNEERMGVVHLVIVEKNLT